MLNFVKKIAKICDIQKLKPIPWQLKVFQYLIIQPLSFQPLIQPRFSGPWDSNNLNNDNKCQKKYEKIASFVKKC